MAIESGVSLQADSLSTVPGGPVRFIQMSMPISGQQTLVQAQVVAVTDANGVVLDWNGYSTQMNDILDELRELRKLIALWMGVPVISRTTIDEDTPTIFSGGPGA